MLANVFYSQNNVFNTGQLHTGRLCFLSVLWSVPFLVERFNKLTIVQAYFIFLFCTGHFIQTQFQVQIANCPSGSELLELSAARFYYFY